MMKYWDYLNFVWKKIILRHSDYKKDIKFPFAIEDLDPDVKLKMIDDFQGKIASFFKNIFNNIIKIIFTKLV